MIDSEIYIRVSWMSTRRKIPAGEGFQVGRSWSKPLFGSHVWLKIWRTRYRDVKPETMKNIYIGALSNEENHQNVDVFTVGNVCPTSRKHN